ncbi:MAG TPA: AbrB/MazE/SpoVT family DNA-binding domain-containing protein [Planctomycetota bacterium]|nr:AbrB/MazE/SpoVT family DNA-binding domain-containing protein [Planctomycetota bacterium]
MSMATVSSKGQITIPVRARRALGIKANSRVILEVTKDSLVVRPAPDFFELEGFLGRSLPPDEERRLMAEGVARHVLEKE